MIFFNSITYCWISIFFPKKKNLLDEYFKKLIVTLHCLFIPPYVCNISRQFENLNNLIYI